MNIALAWLHIVTGLFFTITGYRKCFMADVRAKVFGLFDRHGVPKGAQYVVIAGELLGGLGLLVGLLTHLAAAGLLVIMAGAYALDTWPSVKAKQATPCVPSQLCSNLLCTPEAQLIVILVAILLAGGGAVSLDHFLL